MVAPKFAIMASALLAFASGAVIKRAYPESCPEVQILNSTPNVETFASALYAWQLVSLTGMGTPFGKAPCADNDTYGMTCIVPSLINNATQGAYNKKLPQFGIDTNIVDVVATARAGCAANLDTRVTNTYLDKYFSLLITSLTASVLKPSLAATFCKSVQDANLETLVGGQDLRNAVCKIAGMQNPHDVVFGHVDPKIAADALAERSHVLAWQLGGTLLDTKWANRICHNSTSFLKSGFDLVGMDSGAFFRIACGIAGDRDSGLQGGLPTPTETDSLVKFYLTRMWGEIMFGLGHDKEYQCALCQDIAFNQDAFPDAGLDSKSWQYIRAYACAEGGYSDAVNAQC